MHLTGTTLFLRNFIYGKCWKQHDTHANDEICIQQRNQRYYAVFNTQFLFAYYAMFTCLPFVVVVYEYYETDAILETSECETTTKKRTNGKLSTQRIYKQDVTK